MARYVAPPAIEVQRSTRGRRGWNVAGGSWQSITKLARGRYRFGHHAHPDQFSLRRVNTIHQSRRLEGHL